MKHLLLTLAFGLTMGIATQAQSLDYLTFRTANGSEQSLPIDGLKMTFSDGKLLVHTPSEEVSFALTDLNSFYFTAEPSAVHAVEGGVIRVSIVSGQLQTNAPEGSHITVYSLDGRKVSGMGLLPGTYIVRVNNQTFKTLAK